MNQLTWELLELVAAHDEEMTMKDVVFFYATNPEFKYRIDLIHDAYYGLVEFERETLH